MCNGLVYYPSALSDTNTNQLPLSLEPNKKERLKNIYKMVNDRRGNNEKNQKKKWSDFKDAEFAN